MATRPPLPPTPEFGAELEPAHRSEETLELLALRRSTPVAMLGEPGPSLADLADLLRLATRVPDHRKLEPWRILTIEGAARGKLGELFADALKSSDPDASEKALAEARGLPMRAPVIVSVISAPVDDPKQTPEWEQRLSAGALCQNLLVAASAMGFAACWITEWPAYNAHVAKALGISTRERIAGFVYLGSARGKLAERQRPDLGGKVTRWTGA